jgi:hypothetical protein
MQEQYKLTKLDYERFRRIISLTWDMAQTRERATQVFAGGKDAGLLLEFEI